MTSAALMSYSRTTKRHSTRFKLGFQVWAPWQDPRNEIVQRPTSRTMYKSTCNNRHNISTRFNCFDDILESVWWKLGADLRNGRSPQLMRVDITIKIRWLLGSK